MIAERDVANAQIHEITATQFAVDGKIEHGQIAYQVFVLEVDSDDPDVPWADQLGFVPGFPSLESMAGSFVVEKSPIVLPYPAPPLSGKHAG
ncbi:MAG: hypothetical protein AW07_02629 [Candidatus Accumulibacter sp. SK-11]|nr:MAG: hypothetical protein AW07_02629 [Candidatus Accumulibacter sp. SK-11]